MICGAWSISPHRDGVAMPRLAYPRSATRRAALAANQPRRRTPPMQSVVTAVAAYPIAKNPLEATGTAVVGVAAVARAYPRQRQFEGLRVSKPESASLHGSRRLGNQTRALQQQRVKRFDRIDRGREVTGAIKWEPAHAAQYAGPGPHGARSVGTRAGTLPPFPLRV